MTKYLTIKMLDWVQKRAGNKRNVSEELFSIPDGKSEPSVEENIFENSRQNMFSPQNQLFVSSRWKTVLRDCISEHLGTKKISMSYSIHVSLFLVFG